MVSLLILINLGDIFFAFFTPGVKLNIFFHVLNLEPFFGYHTGPSKSKISNNITVTHCFSGFVTGSHSILQNYLGNSCVCVSVKWQFGEI